VGYDISYDRLVGWEADLRLLTERVAGSLFTRPEPRATFTDLALIIRGGCRHGPGLGFGDLHLLS
jgi:hypothetical protein